MGVRVDARARGAATFVIEPKEFGLRAGQQLAQERCVQISGLLSKARQFAHQDGNRFFVSHDDKALYPPR